METYLQSGNAAFETGADPLTLATKIRAAFIRQFGFDSPAAVRSSGEIDAILTALPFTAEEIAQATMK